MNKSHRVIWSVVRNCFVVASEVAKAKGKPSSTRKAVAVAVATLFIAPGVASAVEDVGQELVGAPYINNYVNNDILEATALNPNGVATAYGVRVGDIAGTGSIGNTGTIEAFASAFEGTAPAALAIGYGIKADSLGSAATISNDGTINVFATAVVGAVSSAQAYGIYVAGDADGTITNATVVRDANGDITSITPGNINLNVGGIIDPEAYGVYVGGNLNGAIDNSGNIGIALAIQPSAAFKGNGVYVGGDIVGSVTNKGTITLNLNPVNKSYVGAGIYTEGNLGVNGKIDNQKLDGVMDSGIITVRANDASGIYVKGEADGQITNSGDITVASGITGKADASGIRVGGNLNSTGDIINSGNVTVDATSTVNTEVANAYGVRVGLDVIGDITNSATGKIETTATGNDVSANAYSVYVGANLSGKVTNASGGTITATTTVTNATADDSAQAYGIYVGNVVDGSIDNAGTITVNATLTGEGTTGANFANAVASGIKAGGIASGAEIKNAGTIDVTATANGEVVNAKSYGVHIDGDVDGTLNNTIGGTITATSTVVANGITSDATAYAVYVGNNLSGTLTNAGTITATATANGSTVFGSGGANAYGVYVGNNLTGTLTNAGSINATATINVDEQARAYGVYVGNDLTGAITNSGNITANVTANSETPAFAYGVYVGGSLTGTLTNTSTGTITATATADTSSNADAYGVYVGNGIASGGTLTNAGEITATVTVNDSRSGFADAYGVYVINDMAGTLTNTSTGSITATATVNDSSSAEAYGVLVTNLTGTLENSGTITADATVNGNSSAKANAVRVSGNLTGTLRNTSTGTITATANSTDSDATAYGVYVGNNLAGTLTNAGAIAATAISGASGFVSLPSAYGVYVNGNLNNLNNSNSITANATAINSSASAQAYAVYVDSDIISTGTLTNSGTIEANATGDRPQAYGVRVNRIAGELNNSGTIKATASGNSTNQAYGVYVNNNLTGTITNSGTISATIDNEGPLSLVFSMFVFNGTGSITNQSSGVLDGRVAASGTVSLTNDGLINTRLGQSFVGGNYTQGASGVFKLSALSIFPLDYGSIFAAGNVNLATGTTIRVDVQSGNSLQPTDILENVISAGGTLNMSTVKVLDNSLALNFTAANDGSNGVDLTAVGTGVTSVQSAVLASGLSSASNAGSVIDSLLAADSLLPLTTSPTQLSSFLNTFYALNNAQEVTDKVAELLPVLNGNINNATLDTMRMLNLAVNQRMDQQGGMSSGDLAFSNEHFWFKPFGSWANQDKRSGSNGYDARSYGIAFGADGQLTEANTVGLAFAYARTDVDADGASQKADVDSYQAGLYGSYKISDVTSLNYQADFAYHDNSARRTITGVGTAKSDFDSWSGHLGATLAYSIPVDEATTFTPSIRADYSRIRAESYTEKGAGVLSLNVGNMTTEQFIVGADGKLVRKISDNASAFANFGVGYDVINERTSVTSSFAGVPGAVFTTRGVDPSPWLMRGGLGLVGQATESLELSLRYDFEVRNDFDNHTASVKARWAF